MKGKRSGPTARQLLHGSDTPTDSSRRLTAGPVTALHDGADIRNIRFGGVELVQRIYVAVRDDVWNTVPAKLSNVAVEANADSFEITFTAHHAYGDIDFTWNGRITGASDGTITYEFNGTSGRAFRYAKIGFNLHHALASAVGRPYEAHTPGGDISGVLPVIVDPQRLIDGRLTAIFPEYDKLTLHPTEDVRVEFTFDGDLFEMQGHRNWTDANYKSYGTPLSVPWPIDASPGQAFYQKVTVRAVGSPGRHAEDAPRVRVSTQPSGRLPAIGPPLMPEHLPLPRRESQVIRRLGPAHVPIAVYLDDADRPAWPR